MKRNVLTWAALATLLVCVVGATTGCGSKNPLGRRAVEGTISIDGTPIAQGSIEFTPDSSNAVQTRSGAAITDGKFKISETKGLAEGSYLVAVSTARWAPNRFSKRPFRRDTVPKRKKKRPLAARARSFTNSTFRPNER